MAFEFFSPGLFSIAGQAGAEYIVLDMEHSGVGPDAMKDQFAFARGTGVMPFVRVPGLAHHLIAPMLDAGAMGIMVPLVETAEQARCDRRCLPLSAARTARSRFFGCARRLRGRE